jgi:SAM-dependent methyltransferase
MADDRLWRGFDAVVTAELAPGSRILDVGSGDGGFVERLAQLGYDSAGVDPKAPRGPRLTQARVEDADGLGRFDAVTAVMALHHVDLAAVVPALARVLGADGWLFVSEFEWSAYDERAAAWLDANDPSRADNSVAGWLREHEDLHTGATLRAALAGTFEPVSDVRRPYLARMLGQHELEAEEQALIDAGDLPALGFWYVARLSSI